MAAHARIGALLFAALIGVACRTPSEAIAQDYDLTFTLPTAGKSGCMVCHQDPDLGQLEGDRWVSFWVDPEPLDAGPHAEIMCTGCHADFAYTAPHNIAQSDWTRTAKLSCKNCHQDQWTAYSSGVHTIAVQPGTEATAATAAKPLCGDCHGGHGIRALKEDPEGRAELHGRGREVCGECHEDYWDNYSDYYHGAAYNQGASDAPACWQCHGYHDVLPSDDRQSAVHESNLEETCGKCHKEINEQYVSYAGLVHQRQKAYTKNPVYSAIQQTRDSIRELLGMMRSWFT